MPRITKEGSNALIVSWREEEDRIHVEMDWAHQEEKPSPAGTLDVAAGIIHVAHQMILDVTESVRMEWKEREGGNKTWSSP